MTVSVIVMIVIGLILIFVSFFVSEKFSKREENFNADLLTVNDDYEFSDRELRIIKDKIEDVIADQAKEILYETNESLSNMANEKTLALGDYAVTVCDEIERNHKEVMFLYSMLDDKQKEITKTVQSVDKAKQELKDTVTKVKAEYEDDLNADDNRSELNSQIIKLKTMERQHSAMNKDLKASPDIYDANKEWSDSIEGKKVSGKSVQESNVEESSFASKEMTREKLEQDAFQNISDEDNLMESELAFFDDEEELADLDDVFSDMDQTDLDDEFKRDHNSNDIILDLYSKGSSIVSIARELGIGVGEVKLVIDLYQGD